MIKVGCVALCWPDQPYPISVDIEVRLGKAPDIRTSRFEVIIPVASGCTRTRAPYGMNVPSGLAIWCPFESGNNPHDNCLQGAVLANLCANTATLVAERHPKYPYIRANGFALEGSLEPHARPLWVSGAGADFRLCRDSPAQRQGRHPGRRRGHGAAMERPFCRVVVRMLARNRTAIANPRSWQEQV